MLEKIVRVKKFFGDFSPKKCFSTKNIFFAIRILYMFMHTKYHGGTPKTCIGKKTPVNFAFLFVDFKDFACFGHGLESFPKGQ